MPQNLDCCWLLHSLQINSLHSKISVWFFAVASAAAAAVLLSLLLFCDMCKLHILLFCANGHEARMLNWYAYTSLLLHNRETSSLCSSNIRIRCCECDIGDAMKRLLSISYVSDYLLIPNNTTINYFILMFYLRAFGRIPNGPYDNEQGMQVYI